MRVLLVSTPVSPIGAGDGGGVETVLRQLAPALRDRGHTVGVVAPAGSLLPHGITVHQIEGQPAANATTSVRASATSVQSQGVLEWMWDHVRQSAPEHDIVIALTYDWLSYYLTPFLPIPVLHWITLASSIDTVDAEIREQYKRMPERFAFYSRTQASTFSFVDSRHARIIPGAVDTDRFLFNPRPESFLVWAARISPEKGLDDAVRVAHETGLPLHVCGKIQDHEYWRRIRSSVPEGTIEYHGLLSHEDLARVLGRALAMLVTPKWVEAFGLTVLEALACGTPVIAYRQGGPAEIIQEGRSGFLVAPHDVAAMANAVGSVTQLRRADARLRAEEFRIDRMAGKIEQWIAAVRDSPVRVTARGIAASEPAQ
jgi:UDP-glucose:tetrahydrobiopterin glucosyltransferase